MMLATFVQPTNMLEDAPKIAIEHFTVQYFKDDCDVTYNLHFAKHRTYDSRFLKSKLREFVSICCHSFTGHRYPLCTSTCEGLDVA